MHLSGQTPLFRAKNLEKHLGIDSIYLKLEGSNPSGHKNDRIAESLVQFAYDQGFQNIFVYGSEQYVKSISHFALGKEMTLYGHKSKESTLLQKKYPEINWISIKRNQSMDTHDQIEQYAISQGYFLMSEWEKKPFIRSLAIQKITEEILERVSEPATIWTQINGGYTLKSIYHELMRSWVNGKIVKIPQINCGVHSLTLKRLAHDDALSETIASTKATLYDIGTEKLKEAVRLLKRLENISISAGEAYALAALIENGASLPSPHIVILNDGRNDIEISEISKHPSTDKSEIVTHVRKLLEPYHDSIEETSDAVQKAIDVGFIFKATHNGEIQGICVVVHMGFSDFIPSYHLAYIGVKKGNKGRGIATELINQAIDKTGGNLSLHVDIPNGRAKKLYEKMGFVHMYDRMLYKG